MGLRNGLYSRDETVENSRYNSNYVTKLLRNFRSHPEILEVPNQRFYRFELQPWADVAEREKFCGWNVIILSLHYNMKLINLLMISGETD